MIAELVATSWLALMGSLVLALSEGTSMQRRARAFAALPIGLSLNVTATSVCLGLGLGFQPLLPVILVAALTAALLLRRRGRHKLSEVLSALFESQIASLAIVALLGMAIHPILTNDSYLLIEYGRWLEGDHMALTTRFFADWPLNAMHLQAWAPRLGADYLVFVLAGAGLSGVFAAFEIVFKANNWSTRATVLFAAFLAGQVATTYMLRAQAGLLNSHAACAGFLCLAVALADRRDPATGRRTGVVLVALLAAGLALTRMEGLILSALVMAFLVALSPVKRRDLIVLGLVGVCAPAPYYLRLATASEAGSVLSPLRILMALTGILLFLVTLWVVTHPRARLLVARFSLLAFPVVALVACLLRPDSALESLTALVGNALATGNWGTLWWWLLPATVVVALAPNPTGEQQAWTALLAALFALLIFLGALRQFPYRLGWGDSGNRMLVHVAPVFVLYTAKWARYRHNTAETVSEPGDRYALRDMTDQPQTRETHGL